MIRKLVLGRDVLAMLPTEFGKSMIYAIFASSNEDIRSKSCVLVIFNAAYESYPRPNRRIGVPELDSVQS